MERLTRWNGEKYVMPQGRTSEGESYWRIIADRLAEFENLGVEPAKLKEILDSMKAAEDYIIKNFCVEREFVPEVKEYDWEKVELPDPKAERYDSGFKDGYEIGAKAVFKLVRNYILPSCLKRLEEEFFKEGNNA